MLEWITTWKFWSTLIWLALLCVVVYMTWRMASTAGSTARRYPWSARMDDTTRYPTQAQREKVGDDFINTSVLLAILPVPMEIWVLIGHLPFLRHTAVSWWWLFLFIGFFLFNLAVIIVAYLLRRIAVLRPLVWIAGIEVLVVFIIWAVTALGPVLQANREPGGNDLPDDQSTCATLNANVARSAARVEALNAQLFGVSVGSPAYGPLAGQVQDALNQFHTDLNKVVIVDDHGQATGRPRPFGPDSLNCLPNKPTGNPNINYDPLDAECTLKIRMTATVQDGNSGFYPPVVPPDAAPAPDNYVSPVGTQVWWYPEGRKHPAVKGFSATYTFVVPTAKATPIEGDFIDVYGQDTPFVTSTPGAMQDPKSPDCPH